MNEFVVPLVGPLYGCYRAIIVDVDDDEQRARYRVHVYNVHRYFDTNGFPQTLTRDLLTKLRDGGSSLPSYQPGPSDGDGIAGGPTLGTGPQATFQGYPWAELIAVGSKYAGDVPYYHIGDLVIVEFEGGDRDKPFILGSWFSQTSGIPDLPPEHRASYSDTRYKWMRTDMNSSNVEVSGISDELWARISSGDANCYVSRTDDSIRFKTWHGTVGFDVGAFSVNAEDQGAFVSGTDVFIQARASDSTETGPNDFLYPYQMQATLGLYSTCNAHLYAAEELYIGQYQSRKNAFNDTSLWPQTRSVMVAPNNLTLGVVCIDTMQQYTRIDGYNAVQMYTTKTVDMEAEKYVVIRVGKENTLGTGPSAGRLGMYSNGDAYFWAYDQITEGQFLCSAFNPLLPNAKIQAQTSFHLMAAETIYMGVCPEAPLYPPGFCVTQYLEGWAKEHITLRTCGATSITGTGPLACPYIPPLTLGTQPGDILIWAEHNLILCANNEVIICEPIYPDPIYALRWNNCKLQYTTDPCQDFPDHRTWIDVSGFINFCQCCSSSSGGSTTGSGSYGCVQVPTTFTGTGVCNPDGTFTITLTGGNLVNVRTC